MNARRNWLCISDINTVPNAPRDIEAEQEENLQAAIGLTLWAALDEVENAPRP